MSNHRGSKLRHVASITDKAKTYTSGVADCGHSFTRQGRLSVGQRIFCYEPHFGTPEILAKLDELDRG